MLSGFPSRYILVFTACAVSLSAAMFLSMALPPGEQVAAQAVIPFSSPIASPIPTLLATATVNSIPAGSTRLSQLDVGTTSWIQILLSGIAGAVLAQLLFILYMMRQERARRERRRREVANLLIREIDFNRGALQAKLDWITGPYPVGMVIGWGTVANFLRMLATGIQTQVYDDVFLRNFGVMHEQTISAVADFYWKWFALAEWLDTQRRNQELLDHLNQNVESEHRMLGMTPLDPQLYLRKELPTIIEAAHAATECLRQFDS